MYDDGVPMRGFKHSLSETVTRLVVGASVQLKRSPTKRNNMGRVFLNNAFYPYCVTVSVYGE